MTVDLRYIIIPAISLLAFLFPAPVISLLFDWWGYHNPAAGITASIVFGVVLTVIVFYALSEALLYSPIKLWIPIHLGNGDRR